MAKKSSKARSPKPAAKGLGQTLRDRNLAAMSSINPGLEPTEAVPINQHKRMAGAG